MYEIIDHTADVGIRVTSPSLEGLFVEAAGAMFDMMVEQRRALIPSIEVPVQILAPTLDELMVRWLSELLYVFETRRLVFTNFWIDELGEGRLVGSAKGLKFDSARHAQKLAIKAVTYHRIRVERFERGWMAEVVFDI